MKFSILLPHYKNWKITTYAIHKLLEHKGKHEIEIIVVDNNAIDGSSDEIEKRVGDKITLLSYPINRLQSHGIAFDLAMRFVPTEYFITVESDSFPMDDSWLDYYEDLANQGFDCAGSHLRLSGGTYIHPAGAMYKRSVYMEAKKFCAETPYAYFPNISMKQGFAAHLMVHKKILDSFMDSPSSYITLSDEYKNQPPTFLEKKLKWYLPTVDPFHNGMGARHESIHTYGDRNIQSDSYAALLKTDAKIIERIGYEPGQWFCYWMAGSGYKLYGIPTETKWIAGLEGRQQEYTINQAGFKHIWGGSAYIDIDKEDLNEIGRKKNDVTEKLYQLLPEEIKSPTMKTVGL